MISVRNLTRRFGDFAALDQVSFDVSGGICALLGPNGAGKSTLVKIMTGLLLPSAGEVFVDGQRVQANSLDLRRKLGIVPENLGLFDSLTVEEHLALSGPIYGVSAAETKSRADQLLRVLGLEHGRATFASQCSYGMRKKTALAMALLHNPKYLFLDEPFEGIDPVASATIRELLLEVARRGVTVFLTSHILSIVDRLADRIVMIRGGRIVWNSGLDELTQPLEELYFELVEAPRREELAWLGL